MLAPPTLYPHSIEFPFTFAYSEIHHDIKGIPHPDPLTRKGLILCRDHTFTVQQIARLEEVLKMKVEETWGSPSVLRDRFMKAKYFVYFREHTVSRGNAVAEAIAGGALVITGYHVSNRDIFKLSGTLLHNFNDILDSITSMEFSPKKYQQTLEIQRNMANFLLFDRPLYQLLERSQAVLNVKL